MEFKIESVLDENNKIIPNKFYALTIKELKVLKEAGVITTAGYVYLYFRCENPFSDKTLTFSAKELAFELGIPESSLSSALKKLKSLGWIKVLRNQLTIQLVLAENSGSRIQQKSVNEKPYNGEYTSNKKGFGKRYSKTKSQTVKRDLESQNKISNSKTKSGTVKRDLESKNEILNFQSSKPAPGADPSSSKTLQTNKEYIDLDREQKKLEDPWLENEETNTKVDEFKQELENQQASLGKLEENNSTVEGELVEEQASIVSTSDKEPATAIVANPNLSQGKVYSACITFESRFKHRAANPKQTNLERLSESLNWVPPGAWCTSEGKLDPSFIKWSVDWWIAKWGGNEHSAKADVKAYYRNDLARLADKWEEYSETYLAKYKNADLRLSHGCKVDEKEEKELKSNIRAVTKPLPPGMSCVDRLDSQERPTQESFNGSTSSLSLPPEKSCVDRLDSQERPTQESFNGSTSSLSLSQNSTCEELSGEKELLAFGDEQNSNSRHLNQELKLKDSNKTLPISLGAPLESGYSNNTELPKDEHGATNNPQAYKPYKPDKEEPKITPEQLEALKKKISKFTKGFGGGLTEKRDGRLDLSDRTIDLVITGRVRLTPEMLERLNQDLADPILAQSAIAKAKKLGCEILMNENGIPRGIEAGF